MNNKERRMKPRGVGIKPEVSQITERPPAPAPFGKVTVAGPEELERMGISTAVTPSQKVRIVNLLNQILNLIENPAEKVDLDIDELKALRNELSFPLIINDPRPAGGIN